ncbi:MULTISPECIES: YlmH family RNA-binding protein [Lacticaseibacillus]|uniref:RNA-binding protein n=1 Tax=Lacticaseibacillus yichunensis TaxID=2486015 RepID=A0ABW4CQI9_9LACO|nr:MULTISPECIES: YlmH/Sll1252 family protein [Lacticaseibacillus]
MDNIYQHFRKEEAPLIDHLAEQIAIAATEYRPVLTDFLDPRQRYIARTLIGGQSDVEGHEFGGYPDAERARLLLAPSYFEPLPADFNIALLTIKYPEKFAEMHHSQVLGTLVNAGVAREVFGDIITDGQTWQVFATQTMQDWLVDNVTKIGRIGVRLVPTDLDARIIPRNDWEEAPQLLASLRLDNVVAHVFNISRNRAKTLIEGDKVRLNFAETDRPDLVIGSHDLVSVRGFGRLRIRELTGTTQKGKLRVMLDVIHK